MDNESDAFSQVKRFLRILDGSIDAARRKRLERERDEQDATTDGSSPLRTLPAANKAHSAPSSFAPISQPDESESPRVDGENQARDIGHLI